MINSSKEKAPATAATAARAMSRAHQIAGPSSDITVAQGPKGWRTEKRWSDRFLPEIKAILGAHLIAEPPIEEDAERNTDLIVLRLDTVRVAVRVRRNKYLLKYSNGFTMRCGRPSGVKVELTKVLEGWGQYFLYGFENRAGNGLAAWTLADLNVFRLNYHRQCAKLPPGLTPGDVIANGDGSSDFAAFGWADFPPALIVARGGDHFAKRMP